eukprot:5441768-Amphidinium_carterae.1
MLPKITERKMREATTKAVLGRMVAPYATNAILQTLIMGYPRITDIQVNALSSYCGARSISCAAQAQPSSAQPSGNSGIKMGRGRQGSNHWRILAPRVSAVQSLDRQVHGDRPRANACNHSQQTSIPLCWLRHHGHQSHVPVPAAADAMEPNDDSPRMGGLVLAKQESGLYTVRDVVPTWSSAGDETPAHRV